MGFETKGWRSLVLATLISWGVQASAADIGGWYAERQRIEAQETAAEPPASCREVIAQASMVPTGFSAYSAAICYLAGESPNLEAARALLVQASEMNFLAARLLLRSLEVAEVDAHPRQRHCHDLGEGRQLCHGSLPSTVSVE